MALMRWGGGNDLFSQFERMRRDMDQLMSGETPWWRAQTRSGYRTYTYPSLNLYNDGEGFVLRAEVPGVEPTSLDVEVTGDTLTIRGERKLPELAEGASYHRRERDGGEFSRSITLPDRVHSGKVAASCSDGILEIHLPFAEEAKARKVNIKTS